MERFKISKVTALPGTLEPNSIYCVKHAHGTVDMFITDNEPTGTAALPLSGNQKVRVFHSNSSGSSFSESTGQVGIWTRTFNTSSSSNQVFITTNGTNTGTSIFSDLSKCAINLNVTRDTTSDSESPWVHHKVLGTNSLTFQVKKSNTGGILIGGIYSGNVNNTSNISITISVQGILNPAI